jgi:predicted transposase YbfD/YdcC
MVATKIGNGLDFLTFFEGVPEPRQRAKVLYPLSELLLCCLVGVICGANGWVEIEEYCEAKLGFLRRFLAFEHGIASHDTFSDVFNALDREAFASAFIAWAGALQENIREIIAIDGKTLRRSFDRARGRGAIHMISAWASSQRLVLGQMNVDAKTNEITAIPELLALLSLKGAIVTVDAIGCQKKIAKAIRSAGADYLLALKQNQETLHRDVVEFLEEQRTRGFADCAAGRWQTLETTDADHGRIEVRNHWIVDDIEWLKERHPEWLDLTSIAMVESRIENPGGSTSSQTRYYIASLRANANEFATAARQHWGVESGLHYVLDVVFREDDCRIRSQNGPANFATFRHLALNMLQRTQTPKKKSIRVKRGLAAISDEFLAQVLTAP